VSEVGVLVGFRPASNRQSKEAFRVFTARKLLAVVVLCLTAYTTARSEGQQPTVLHKNDGDLRTRRPREGVASPATEFLLKFGPKTNGSKHLLIFTEELRPGAVIPKHRHHKEDEVILVQSGRAHVWLGDKEYDAEAGAMVFIPAGTWISLKNTGQEDVGLVSIWNEPAFEEMLLCGSVPKGQTSTPLSRDDVKNCYHHGDAELEVVQSAPPAGGRSR
jgi:mannose-6-phosphate isomerase-like protein (cupin superfamily)